MQLESAYALALEVGDLCWASVASRSLAAVANDQRDTGAANAWTERSLEHTLPYVWVLAHAVEGKCDVTRSTNEDTSRTTVHQLAACAGRTGSASTRRGRLFDLPTSETTLPVRLLRPSAVRSTTRTLLRAVDRGRPI